MVGGPYIAPLREPSIVVNADVQHGIDTVEV